MIRTVRQTLVRRVGTSLSFLFVPNDERFKFESENLTPEENRAAIPRRPNFNHLPKYHHEILSPENVADVLSRLLFTELFTTSLAKNAPLSGNADYLVISTKGDATTVNLHFAVTASKWFEVFNDEIIKLQDLGEAAESLAYFNEKLHHEIEQKVTAILATITDDAYSQQWLNQIYSRMTNNLSHGSTISFGALANHFLDSETCIENSHNMLQVLSYVDRNISQMTAENIATFTTKLVNVLYGTHISDIRAKLEGLNVVTSNPTVQNLLSELDSSVLDKLAYLHTVASNFQQANSVLRILVRQRHTAPSSDTFDLFLSSYLKHMITSKQDTQIYRTLLCELTALKPAIFHHGVTPAYAMLMLDGLVTSEFELQHFVNLIFQSKQSSEIVKKLSKPMVEKAIALGKDQSTAVLKVKLNNLVKRLQVHLDDSASTALYELAEIK